MWNLCLCFADLGEAFAHLTVIIWHSTLIENHCPKFSRLKTHITSPFPFPQRKCCLRRQFCWTAHHFWCSFLMHRHRRQLARAAAPSFQWTRWSCKVPAWDMHQMPITKKEIKKFSEQNTDTKQWWLGSFFVTGLLLFTLFQVLTSKSCI